MDTKKLDSIRALLPRKAKAGSYGPPLKYHKFAGGYSSTGVTDDQLHRWRAEAARQYRLNPDAGGVVRGIWYKPADWAPGNDKGDILIATGEARARALDPYCNDRAKGEPCPALDVGAAVADRSAAPRNAPRNALRNANANAERQARWRARKAEAERAVGSSVAVTSGAIMPTVAVSATVSV